MRVLLTSILWISLCCTMSAQTFNKNTTYQGELNVYAGSFVGDVNQDGYDDVICCDKRYVYLYLNNGADSIGFTKFDLGIDQSSEKNFRLWDVDGDGDLDILMGVSGRIILIENQSIPKINKFVKSNIDFLFFGSYTKNLIHFDFGDLNGDSLYDIVVSYGRTEAFFQRENKSFFRFLIANASFNDVTKIEMADLNGDKRMDLLISGNDTTNQQGLLFLNNSNNNFSSGTILNDSSISNFFINKKKDSGQVEIAAISRADEGSSLITYNHNTSGDSLSFKEVNRFNLGSGNPVVAFGQLNQNNDLDMVLGYSVPASLQLWNDFKKDTTLLFEPLDSIGSIKAVYISDLDQDGDDDIIVFTDKNAFYIYEQIVEPVYTVDSKQHVVTLSPNPAGDFLHINADMPIKRITVSDMTGRIIGVYDGQNETSIWLDIQNLKSGIYIVTLVINEQIITGKLFFKL